MLPELATLREVQGFDIRLAACDRALARVPRALDGIDGEVAAARSHVEAVEEELRQTAAERRHAETELEEAEANVDKYGDQLLGARTNEEYKGLQQQIASAKTRIGTIEDRILAQMEKADELEAKLADRKRTFAERSTVLEAQKTEIRSTARDQEAQRDQLRRLRAVSFAGLPEEIAARYERIRAREGIAVVPVRDGRCSACNVRLRPQVLEEIHAGRSILACEPCARILFLEAEPAAKSA
ncbi:MAG: C4-type zinc ribbon domain-containing protein [Acidobacteriota bacterium]|nr:C4-type zinc ribbon domain-containing protein [Acidobacteriota bacterium]MXX86021.1 hypothetical protein [Acidobacteriota bacterium]MYG76174.1 hypothetical protein [Acidobacteriota bacterium]